MPDYTVLDIKMKDHTAVIKELRALTVGEQTVR